jgi:hypothetical protein
MKDLKNERMGVDDINVPALNIDRVRLGGTRLIFGGNCLFRRVETSIGCRGCLLLRSCARRLSRSFWGIVFQTGERLLFGAGFHGLVIVDESHRRPVGSRLLGTGATERLKVHLIRFVDWR